MTEQDKKIADLELQIEFYKNEIDKCNKVNIELTEQLRIGGVSNSLVADIRNKLSSPKNLVAMLKESPLLHHPNVKIHEMIRKEMEQTLKNIEYLSNL